jgi:hypothetical protein
VITSTPEMATTRCTLEAEMTQFTAGARSTICTEKMERIGCLAALATTAWMGEPVQITSMDKAIMTYCLVTPSMEIGVGTATTIDRSKSFATLI